MTETAGNPLLEPWTGPFGAPPFRDIEVAHFRPALDTGMAEQRAETDAIAEHPAAATFDNTIVALEMSGFNLDRVRSVFFNLSGSHTNDEIQTIERDVAPLLARHSNEISLNATLFARIASLWERRAALGLDVEQARVLERYHINYLRAGAGLNAAGKTRLAEINERMATLATLFGQNILADEKAYALILDGAADLAGLPDFVVAAAAQAAAERGVAGRHVITLSRSSIEPFLQFSKRRDLREKAFTAWSKRGENDGPNDNRPIMAEMIDLRAERAGLMGFDSFADFKLADTMAKTPGAARELLDTVWAPARRRAAVEEADLQALATAEGGNFKIAPWDWRYYSEAVRSQRFAFDEAELKPYLQLESIIDAAFYTANRLFGLAFKERFDVPAYHLDVRVFEVTGADGKPVGLFFGDYFARSSKRSGAWMSSFRDQQRLTGNVRPIVVNVMNFSKPPEGERALLSFDDAHTLFHEFGHALHGLLSDVTYPLISGTSVSRDFVELPSQLYEHWLEQPAILSRFAVHSETGAPMPEALLKKVLLSRTFNQGFATVEYTSSALVDLDLHARQAGAAADVMALEKATLDRIHMPEAITLRHRSPHFGHIFSGGYAAGYYSYLWSEVLDADAFAAFRETGDIFDPALAKRLYDFIYSAGYRCDPATAYQSFRGRLPTSEALLRKRGLAGRAE